MHLSNYDDKILAHRFSDNIRNNGEKKCTKCYLEYVKMAFYRCVCKPNVKICCDCYLKIVDQKCPCCRMNL